MKNNFYNKVAKQFGGYAYGTHSYKKITEYPNEDPEKIFKQKLIELAGDNKIALDVGCGDGKFTFEIANYFLKIIGIDNSEELLKVANNKQKELKIKNTSFELQDANKTSFPNEYFDLIFSRRGPTPYTEFKRLLKKNGYYLGVGIGEKDAKDIKLIFGRGQGFGSWNESMLLRDKNLIEKAGFKTIFAKEYLYDEYYASYKDLDIFLQGVPIFEDFNSKKDKKYLEDYVSKFTTEKGIRFPRHRLVFVAQKV